MDWSPGVSAISGVSVLHFSRLPYSRESGIRMQKVDPGRVTSLVNHGYSAWSLRRIGMATVTLAGSRDSF